MSKPIRIYQGKIFGPESNETDLSEIIGKLIDKLPQYTYQFSVLKIIRNLLIHSDCDFNQQIDARELLSDILEQLDNVQSNDVDVDESGDD